MMLEKFGIPIIAIATLSSANIATSTPIAERIKIVGTILQVQADNKTTGVVVLSDTKTKKTSVIEIGKVFSIDGKIYRIKQASDAKVVITDGRVQTVLAFKEPPPKSRESHFYTSTYSNYREPDYHGVDRETAYMGVDSAVQYNSVNYAGQHIPKEGLESSTQFKSQTQQDRRIRIKRVMNQGNAPLTDVVEDDETGSEDFIEDESYVD